MPRSCTIKGCTAEVKHRFKFPKAKTSRERFLKWVAATGDTNVLSFSPKQLRNRAVCHLHFEPRYMLSKHLSNTAVPTLHLPEKIDVTSYNTDQSDTSSDAESCQGNSQENSLQCKSDNLDDATTTDDTADPLGDGTAFVFNGDDKTECETKNLRELGFTISEESVEMIDLKSQTVPLESTSKRRHLSGFIVHENRRNKRDITLPDPKEMCLCETFSKVGMGPQLTRLCKIITKNPSRDVKSFVKEQLDALIKAVSNRKT